MADPLEFGALYTEALLLLIASLVDVPEIEIYRRYQTDARFHGVIAAIVQTAMQVLKTMESDEYVEQIDLPKMTPRDIPGSAQEYFRQEVNDLLGWRNPDH